LYSKVKLDTVKYKTKWLCHTYQCLTELVSSKVKCLCPQFKLVQHQINIQMRLIFTYSNKFSHDEKHEEVLWRLCQGIFSLITQTHSNFNNNICNGAKTHACLIDKSDCLPLQTDILTGIENTGGTNRKRISHPAERLFL
jgi:hypothetical protein